MFKHGAIAFAVIAGFFSAPSAVMAQSVSGEVGIYSSYLDDDLFVYTNEPVIQAGVYLDVTDNCSLDAWGSNGIATKVGGELDLGASCRFSLSEETEVEVVANRILLRGDDDITEISVGVTHGPVDVTVSRYFWDNNPDAFRIVAGYSFEPTEKLSLRPMMTYETGFGEEDILAGGLSAEYALTEQLSVVGLAVTPIKKGSEDTRGTEANIGIRFSF